jgi:hypothetical protein
MLIPLLATLVLNGSGRKVVLGLGKQCDDIATTERKMNTMNTKNLD